MRSASSEKPVRERTLQGADVPFITPFGQTLKMS
jgi:hypothetical protein